MSRFEADGPVTVDRSGWSAAIKRRYADATPGLSVPRNTPRGRSERRFLALFDEAQPLTFKALYAAADEQPDGWVRRRWILDLLLDLRRAGAVVYDKRRRAWFRTDLGAEAADADAEWIVGPVHA